MQQNRERQSREKRDMLSVYKDSVKIDDYTIEIFCGDSVPDSSVIWLHTFPGEAEEIWERLSGTSTLLAVTGNDWNHQFSPWPASKAFRQGEDFGGGAPDYLKYFLETLLPGAEEKLPFEPKVRGLAGYSMAGLFAVYAMYNTPVFNRIACMSGSLWFDNWKEYALTHSPVPENPAVYLSLGSKEHKTKDQRMSQVKTITEELAVYWGKSCRVTYETVPGGHFTNVAQRIARGITQIEKM